MFLFGLVQLLLPFNWPEGRDSGNNLDCFAFHFLELVLYLSGLNKMEGFLWEETYSGS